MFVVIEIKTVLSSGPDIMSFDVQSGGFTAGHTQKQIFREIQMLTWEPKTLAGLQVLKCYTDRTMLTKARP